MDRSVVSTAWSTLHTPHSMVCQRHQFVVCPGKSDGKFCGSAPDESPEQLTLTDSIDACCKRTAEKSIYETKT